ncbi:MAG: M1 family metallopeptidase [Deferribacteres bacterium]|nr:M1 family metallopeptidase [Deferribacteres bacterium]
MKSNHLLILPTLCFVMSIACVQAQSQGTNEQLSARIANYTIDARLDADTRIVSGTEVIKWRNATSKPTQELQFHLYFNAWRNTNSSFLNSVRYRTQFRDNEYRENDWGYQEIHSIKIKSDGGQEAADLSAAIEYIAPDDGNQDDRTVVRVPLAQPVAPGETISVEIAWDTKVPRTFARTGARGDYFLLAHWFPAIGVLEEAGWNCHQFYMTEFFSDFGIYDVKLTVPTDWVIGATGRETESNDNGDGTAMHRFYQEDVHTFTWVASPYFTVHEQKFEAEGLPSVDMRLLLMPDHADKRERYFKATAAALEHYGSWFGTYPYGHVTVVDPAYGSGTGGMEYPTLFTGGTRWLSPIETRSPEGVTIHECGHQFWFGIMANNEFEDAWLDEGFNTYSTTRTSEAAYPNPVYSRRYFRGFLPFVFSSVSQVERTAGAEIFDGLRSEWRMDKMSTKSLHYGPETYGLNSYSKPGLMLRTLENYFGWETFQKIMSTYFARWKFKHPKPSDYFAVVEEIGGQDMSWFFDQIYDDAVSYDYAVGEVYSQKVGPGNGYEETEDGLIFDLRRDSKNKAEADSAMYTSRVLVRRFGEGIFPVEVKVTFSDGSTALENWDGKAHWTKFDYLKPAKVAKVEVDPEHKLTLDVDYVNNSWLNESKRDIAATKWASKWMIWVQNLIEFFAFFA